MLLLFENVIVVRVQKHCSADIYNLQFLGAGDRGKAAIN